MRSSGARSNPASPPASRACARISRSATPVVAFCPSTKAYVSSAATASAVLPGRVQGVVVQATKYVSPSKSDSSGGKDSGRSRNFTVMLGSGVSSW